MMALLDRVILDVGKQRKIYREPTVKGRKSGLSHFRLDLHMDVGGLESLGRLTGLRVFHGSVGQRVLLPVLLGTFVGRGWRGKPVVRLKCKGALGLLCQAGSAGILTPAWKEDWNSLTGKRGEGARGGFCCFLILCPLQ